MTKTKVYFASDIHLGVPNLAESQERERRFIRWLDTIKEDATSLYIIGDLFDFWFEYKTVVPKGYVRTLGKLAELTDNGLPVHFFVGNHDLWMFSYFQEELNIPVYHQPIQVKLGDKNFLIGHGDGLGPGDKKYKLLKKYLFTNKFCQWLLGVLHPNIGVGLANYFSRRSRASHGDESVFLGEEKEWLITYAKRKLTQYPIDYFVFGHRHLPLDYKLTESSRYVNTGDWINYNSYAVFDGEKMEVKYFENT